MTDSAIVAIGTAIATIIASVTAAVVAIAALRKTTTAAVVADKKADILIEKAVEIHTLTNSRMAKVTSDLEVALAKITGLEARLIGMDDAKTIADRVAADLAAKAPMPEKSTT
jgi:hypothetical protein